MKFYLEAEFRHDQRHPSGYRLCATGPGRFHGDYGMLTDAELAALIVDLLNTKLSGDVPRSDP